MSQSYTSSFSSDALPSSSTVGSLQGLVVSLVLPRLGPGPGPGLGSATSEMLVCYTKKSQPNASESD
ncbi:unnamed protein product [Fusarium graminearum]|uniref:Uncharacterized protein n=1 Tax=Gibberella zeae (strain ATCC MYA-4620 / CBS 123657 / FGSC 9075 / NRRL 31084 / PH-1) TaxID=229533 RepID=A0A0E0SFM5_GIBZE|nr:hypothetical protein FG05_30280 [Fusarium graminearum]CZS72405.1 unnamed protein product [Fusarium graminearum]